MKTITELIQKNQLAASLTQSLIYVAIEHLELPINPYTEYESEEEKYELYDQLYGYLTYDVIEHDGILAQLGINGTSDLIEFYELVNQ